MNELRARVDLALETFLDAEVAELVALDADLAPVAEQARVSVAGGKRIRPAFCYWGWRAAGQPDAESMVRAAAALELVHAAAIVHDDANFDFAFDRIFGGAFGYAGQVCIKVQRIYVQNALLAKFAEKFAEKAKATKPLDPMDEKAVLSSVIDEGNAKRIVSWVEEATKSGKAKLLCGGTREGANVMPTVLAIEGSGRGLKVVDDEVFGPVVTIHGYETWEEGVALAADTRFGLQAGIFTDSQKRIRHAVQTLDVGGIVVNDVPTFRVDNMPYGGVRDSGLGREGVRFAIREMCETKLVVTRDAT